MAKGGKPEQSLWAILGWNHIPIPITLEKKSKQLDQLLQTPAFGQVSPLFPSIQWEGAESKEITPISH